MKDLYLDLVAGISGDMFLGLLVDLGLDVDALRRELEALGVGPFELTAEPAMKGAIGGTRVTVRCPDQEHHRHLPDILEILDRSALPAPVIARSRRVFERLARAEGRVHRIDPDEVHFHEVGALDAILDVVGTVLGLERLGIERIFASPVPLGRGFTTCDHGVIPLPAPAVLELLRGAQCHAGPVEAELTTPTGAALLAELVVTFGPMPGFRLEAVGYGLGQRDLEIPNVVRGLRGQALEADSGSVLLLEANIDDMTPEQLGYLFPVFLDAGALDVYQTPIQMKKGRPGVMVSVMIPPELEAPLTELFFRETTTLGLRRSQVERRTLPRRRIEVSTPYGVIGVKLGPDRIHPEYDDCARAAAEHRVAFRKVYEEARARAEREV